MTDTCNWNRVFQLCLIGVAFVLQISSIVVLGVLNLRSASDESSIVKYFDQVSPTLSTFLVLWPAVVLWNLAAIVYIVVSVFLDQHKSPVNVEPTLVPAQFLIFYISGYGFVIGAQFCMHVQALKLTVVFVIASTIFICIAVAISHKRVFDNITFLEHEETRTLLVAVRIFIHNGLVLFATLLVYHCFRHLTVFAIYEDRGWKTSATLRGGASVQDVSSTVLSVLFACVVVWFILENFVIEKYFRYTFTVFPGLIVLLCGLIAKLYYLKSYGNLILISALLGFCSFAFMFRILAFVYKKKTSRVAAQMQELLAVSAPAFRRNSPSRSLRAPIKSAPITLQYLYQ